MRRGILASRDELAQLRNRIDAKPFDRIYESLRKRCALILETPPVTESQWQTLAQQGRWGSAILAARTAQGRIIDLTIAHGIDANGAYRSRAIEELKDLVSWTTWVDPSHQPALVDLCTAEAAVATVIGLDWLWEDMTRADRLRALQALRHRVIEPYRRTVDEKAWWYSCYHNWNAVVNGGCGLVGLALGDEEPKAQEVYNLARAGLRHFFDALGREGGWDEGTGYWGYGMRYLLLLGEAASRLLDDQRIFHERGMDATGLFPVYFTPNGHAASFGDNPAVPAHGPCYTLVKHYGLKETTWWLDTYILQHDVTTSGWSQAGLALLLRPEDAETPARPDLTPVKVFNEIGWAAMADTWPRPGFYAAIKTGDLAANHSQRDMNSIQLQVDGEMILTDLGNPPYSREYFGESRGEFYEVQARGHNTMVVADRDHRIDAQGQIVEAQSGKDYRWVACDAMQACGENVQFIRHLVMVVDPETHAGKALLVLDELIIGVPERIALFWHTHGKVELKRRRAEGVITGHRAKVHFAVASTVKSSVEALNQKAHGNVIDNVVRISAGVVGRALFAAVFWPAKPSGGIELRQTAAGRVTVNAGAIRVQFNAPKRHLQLARVSVK